MKKPGKIRPLDKWRSKAKNTVGKVSCDPHIGP